MLAYSDIFPEQLGILAPNFAHLLYISVYAKLQIFIQLLQLWRGYSILSATSQHAYQPVVDILSI